MTTIEFFDQAYKTHARYWHHANRDSTDPRHFGEPWRTLLQRLEGRMPGRALDLGAGEGSDAIRLARLGYEVDALEGSTAGAEKIERFAREASVRVNVVHADAASFEPQKQYDVIICSGLLHYLDPTQQIRALATLKAATASGGLNLVTMFTDHTPVPDCHRILDVFPDRNEELLANAYGEWAAVKILDREKLDSSHRDFPPHRHSFIKILAERKETLIGTLTSQV
jgi:SAM-dependent methyltransferase